MSVFHGRGFLFFNILVCVVTEGIASVPDSHKANEKKVKIFEEKLQTLQKLLAEIKNGKIYNKNGITLASSVVIPTSDRQMAPRTRSRDDGEGSIQPLLRAMEKLYIMKSNHRMFRDPMIQWDSAGDALGQFEEKSADTSEEGLPKDKRTNTEERIFTILENLLRAGNPQTSSSESHTRTLRPVIKEGEFGNFQQEALHRVENQLLIDLSQAARDGVTVDEIVKDLTKESRSDDNWHSRENEIERELNSLIKHGA